MTALGDTMELTPKQRPMRKTVDGCSRAVRDILNGAIIGTLCLDLPEQRRQAHDDEDATLSNMSLCGPVADLLRIEKTQPRVRYTPVGAVVYVQDWSPAWVLIRPDYLANEVVRGLLQDTAAQLNENLSRMWARTNNHQRR